MKLRGLTLAVVAALCAASPAVAYSVRGEAKVQGAQIPADCPQIGTTFSAVLNFPTVAACTAHASCTAAKVTAVNNWIAQLNQRQRGHCVQYVAQSTNPCTYNC